LVSDKDGEEIAEIKKGEDWKSFKLIGKKIVMNGTLTKKVHGEFRPFQSLYWTKIKIVPVLSVRMS
jgi:hypothetical protein